MQGEKRCAVCNMRLVSPAKLNRLLNEEKEAETDAFEKFLKDAKKKLGQWGNRLGPGLKKLASAAKVKLGELAILIKNAWAKTRVWLKKTYKILRRKLKQLIRQIKVRIAENKAAPKKASGASAPILRQKKPSAPKTNASRTGASAKKASAVPVRSAASRTARPVSYGEDVYGSKYRPKSVSASRGNSYRSTIKPAAKKTSVPSAKKTSGSTGRPAPGRTVSSRKLSAGRTGTQKKRSYEDDSFAEKNARSIVSMGCLLLAFLLLLMWGTLTGGGKRTFATLGIGSSGGYVLLGDDCMQDGNYSRAVEHYYKALSKKITYEAAYKLAAAYSHTGDISREVSSLLLCVDYYPKHIGPYRELVYLYPYPDDRPEKVARAIQTGEELYGNAIYEP